MLLAAVIAAVVGVIVGLPALRIRGAQLAVVTLAAALDAGEVRLRQPADFVSPTANLIPNPKLFGINLSIRGGRDIARLPFGVMTLIVVAIVFVLVGNVMRAGTGRKMLAVRSNERAASSIGIGVAGIKLAAFALASFLAGLGGCAHRLQPRPALAGVVRRVRRPDLPGDRLPRRHHQRQRRVSWPARSVRSGIVFVIIDRNLHLGKYYAAVQRPVADPHGRAQPGRHRRQDPSRLRRTQGQTGRQARRRRRRPSRTRWSPRTTPLADVGPSPDRVAPHEIGEVVLRTEGITVTYGGLRAVERRQHRGPRRRDRRPDRSRTEPARPASSTRSPASPAAPARSTSTVSRCRACPPTSVPDVVWCARGSRSSCSTTSRSQNNVRVSDDIGKDAAQAAPRLRAAEPAAVAGGPRRDRADGARRRRRPQARRSCRSGGRRRSASPGRWRCSHGRCCSTSRPPASTPRRASPSASTSGRSPPPASPAC